jgi:uncharacterized membrane protein
VIIAAGPWLVSVIALGLVSVTVQPIVGLAAVEDLRLTVVYAFCIAPLVAGPIGAVAARLVAEESESGLIRQAPAIFLVAALGSALVAEGLTIAMVIIMGIGPVEVAAAFVVLTGAAALLWTSFAILTALKAYSFLVWSFISGIVFALTCIVWATRAGISTEILIWSFAAGIVLSVCMALIRVRHAAGGQAGDTVAAAHRLWSAAGQLRMVGWGILFAIAAVWIDKWVYWVTPSAARSDAGFAHFNPYDTVMFVAHLSAIPTYAALLLFRDGDLRRGVERFRADVRDGATHARLRQTVAALSLSIWTGLFSVVFLQGTLTACAVLMAPAAATILGFNFDQILTLRVGLIGVFFHSIFFVCCAVILVCNRSLVFLLLQLGFLICNLFTSILFYVVVGFSAYAFFTSALIAAGAAFVCAYRALTSLDYLTFLGENDGIYARLSHALRDR